MTRDKYPRGSALTPRECEVLRHLCAGHVHKRVAPLMGIDHRTVSEFVRRIRKRTGITNPYRLALWARDNGYAP
jgi:DNA-binding NarL/FixJ family response regulator